MRKNHPKKTVSIYDRFDTDFVDLPNSPHIKQLVSKSMKTIYRNLSAAPWATESPIVETFDENFLPVYHARR